MEEIKKELLEFFKDLKFDEANHKYFVDGVQIEKSVSDKIKSFYYPFDTKKYSKLVGNKTGRTAEEVEKEWDEVAEIAKKKGKQSHLFGEFYPFNRDLRPQSGYDIAIAKFWGTVPEHIKPVVTELRMYHKEKFYAGTLDVLVKNTEDNTFSIIDYKSNKDLFKNYNNRMKGVFSHLVDCPFNKYQIQLSYYQTLFEQTGYEVSKRKIVWIKPDGTFETYDTHDFRHYLD